MATAVHSAVNTLNSSLHTAGFNNPNPGKLQSYFFAPTAVETNLDHFTNS